MNQLGGGVSWSKPVALICHICGREYGTTSLAIHLPQCAKLWKDRQKLLPRSERRPVPTAPMKLSAITSMRIDSKDTAAMEEFNKTMMGVFVEKGLVGCEHCGRRFLEEKLPVHQRSCTAERPAAAVGSHRLKQPLALKPSTAASGMGGGGGDSGRVSFAPTSSAGGGGGSARPMKAQQQQQQMQYQQEESKADDDMPVPSKGYDLSAILSAAEDDGAGAGNSGDMSECSICGRNFNTDRIAKHELICAKTHAKQSARPHTAKPTTTTTTTTTAASADSLKWKSKHNDFQQAIQYAKQLTAAQKSGVPLASLPPPPPSLNPDYVQCPHCQRRFAPNAADRHIPACANTINKPKPPPQARRPMTGGGIRSGATAGGGAGGGGGGGGGGMAGGGLGRAGGGMAVPPVGKPVNAFTSPSTTGNRTTMPPVSPNRGPVPAPRSGPSALSALGAAGSSGSGNGNAGMQSQLKQLTATVAMLAAQVNGGQCKNCRAGLSNGAKFCSQCGTPQ